MSQLNIDNIANQLGTGGPDFVGMPSVGGDPVVESGSNTDGEWARWADGTQECFLETATFNVSSGSEATRSWTFPSAFSTRPVFTPVAHSVTNRGDTSTLSSVGVRQVDTSLTATGVGSNIITRNAAPVAADLRIHLFATGRWK